LKNSFDGRGDRCQTRAIGLPNRSAISKPAQDFNLRHAIEFWSFQRPLEGEEETFESSRQKAVVGVSPTFRQLHPDLN
jgi:hypothetical protein